MLQELAIALLALFIMLALLVAYEDDMKGDSSLKNAFSNIRNRTPGSQRKPVTFPSHGYTADKPMFQSNQPSAWGQQMPSSYATSNRSYPQPTSVRSGSQEGWPQSGYSTGRPPSGSGRNYSTGRPPSGPGQNYSTSRPPTASRNNYSTGRPGGSTEARRRGSTGSQGSAQRTARKQTSTGTARQSTSRGSGEYTARKQGSTGTARHYSSANRGTGQRGGGYSSAKPSTGSSGSGESRNSTTNRTSTDHTYGSHIPRSSQKSGAPDTMRTGRSYESRHTDDVRTAQRATAGNERSKGADDLYSDVKRKGRRHHSRHRSKGQRSDFKCGPAEEERMAVGAN